MTTHYAGCWDSGPKHYECALLEVKRLNPVELEATVVHHEQQIKDIAAHLLELKRLVTPPMIMDDDDLNNVRYKANYRYETKWVGLTDEERAAITDKVIGFNSCCGWEDDYAKAIEAKLKEKNGG